MASTATGETIDRHVRLDAGVAKLDFNLEMMTPATSSGSASLRISVQAVDPAGSTTPGDGVTLTTLRTSVTKAQAGGLRPVGQVLQLNAAWVAVAHAARRSIV